MIVGLNDWSPPGSNAFSVGEGVAALVLGAVVDVVAGASFSFVVEQGVRVPMATRAAPPATTAIRRLKETVLMTCPSVRVAKPCILAANGKLWSV